MKKLLFAFLVVSITFLGASAINSHAAPSSDDFNLNELPSLH